MAHTVGIPIVKGNSDSSRSCYITNTGTARDDIKEGMAVAIREEALMPEVTTLAANPEGFIGFIFDIDPCTFQATLLRAADLVSLPSADAAAFAAGDPLTIDPATGLIDVAGTLTLNGTVVLSGAGADGVNGKTGEAIPNCVLASLGGGRALAAVAP